MENSLRGIKKGSEFERIEQENQRGVCTKKGAQTHERGERSSKGRCKSTVCPSEGSRSPEIERDQKDHDDEEFYRENRITPTHLLLLSCSERKYYEELRSKIRLTILKTERIKTLFKTQEEVAAMSDDSVITAIKYHREGGEAELRDLQGCKEQMLIFMSLTGKNISPRQRRACLNISDRQYRQVLIPSSFSQEAQYIIRALLQKNPDNRFGCRADVGEEEVKGVSFFESIPWEDLEKGKVEPPFQPPVGKAEDTKNFDSQFTQQPTDLPKLNMDKDVRKLAEEGLRGFSFYNVDFDNYGHS